MVDVRDWVKSLPPVTEEQRLKNLAEKEAYEAEIKAKGIHVFMHEATEAAYNKAMGVVGWHYRPIPWMLPEYWTELIGYIGVDEIKVISCSEREGVRRGDILISPQGLIKLIQAVEDGKIQESS